MRQLSSRIAYQNRWMTLREDRIVQPDGVEGIYSVVEKPEFALVVPRGIGGFWLVEQYRYPIGRRAWEFPQGTHPDHAEDTLELARTELAEETGLRAATWHHLGHVYSAYGFCSQGFDAYLARDLVEGAPNREATEADMVHRFFTDPEVGRMVRTGQLVDGASLAALALLTVSELSDWHPAD